MDNMKCLDYDQCKGANKSCTRLGPEHTCSYFEQIEAPEKQPPFGLLERFVKWLKDDFEMTMYRWRPLGDCKGRGCYVLTPGRKNGVPYCLACREKNNPIAT